MSEIFKKVKFSYGAVELTLKWHKTTGSLKSKRQMGRKKTTVREDRIIFCMSYRRTSYLPILKRQLKRKILHELSEEDSEGLDCKAAR